MLKELMIGISLIAAPSMAFAQTSTVTPPATESTSLGSQTDSLTRATFLTNKTISIAAPSRVSASIAKISNDTRLAGKDLSKIEISGHSIPQKGTNKADVKWTTVENTETTRRKLLTDPLESTIEVESGTDLPSSTLEAEGDHDKLVEAILGLLEDTGEEKPVVQEEEQQKDASTSGGSAPSSGNSTAPETTSDFKTPEVIKESSEAEPVEITSITSEGCEPRIDEAQGKVITQVQTLKNGTPSGDCSDSLETFEISKDYLVCPDVTDISNRTANPAYRRYYVGSDLAVAYLDTQCVSDTDVTYTMLEEGTSCGWRMDTTSRTAIKQVLIYYINQNGQRQEMTGCQDSQDEAAFDMVQDPTLCELRHDSGMAYQRAKWTWVYNEEYKASSICEDTGVTFAHFEDRSVCDYAWNVETSQAWPQSRTAYVDDKNKTNYIDASCSPMLEFAQDLLKTTDGCVGVFEDDFASNVTYATQRHYYIDGNNTPQYVNQCAKDDTLQYPLQTRVNGYECHDDKLQCDPKTELYAVVNGAEFIRSEAQVRDGATPVPYTYIAEADIPDEVSYIGCDKTTTTVRTEQYLRPDGEQINKIIGVGDTVGPVFACTVTAAPYWKLQGVTTHAALIRYQNVHGYEIGTNCGASRTDLAHVAWSVAIFKGFRPVSREDGWFGEQESVNFLYQVQYSCPPSSDPGAAPTGYADTLYNQSEADGKEGW
ncbi:hypothetical protein [Aestuariispira insulae]|uniref:Uncharacterized protein n=1 Tax=Aestuariispira insulae TaxID=1461337 RepID=A0A3D9H3P0_9PROT|nr:hypothetical protein [Aestuariispira insulae]RED44114.1 hypothetical protein DFP90_11717 [Aestuariispira insulae]